MTFGFLLSRTRSLEFSDFSGRSAGPYRLIKGHAKETQKKL